MILENFSRFLNMRNQNLKEQLGYLDLRPVSYLILADEKERFALVLNENFFPEKIAYENIRDTQYLNNLQGGSFMVEYEFDENDLSHYTISFDGFNPYIDREVYSYLNCWELLGLKRQLLLIGGSKTFRMKLKMILDREIDREVNEDYINLYLNSFYYYISYGYNYKPGGDDKIWVESETTRLNCDPYLESELSKIGDLNERLHENYGDGSYDKMYREYARFEKKEHIAKLNQTKNEIVKTFLKQYDETEHKKFLNDWIDEQFNVAETLLQNQVAKWLPSHK